MNGFNFIRKFNLFFFLFFFFTAVTMSVTYADYCNLCSNHVACQQNIVSLLFPESIECSCKNRKIDDDMIFYFDIRAQQPSSKCRAIPKLTNEMQNLIVDLHNTYRNEQALGQTGFPTAARMATVVSTRNCLVCCL